MTQRSLPHSDEDFFVGSPEAYIGLPDQRSLRAAPSAVPAIHSNNSLPRLASSGNIPVTPSGRATRPGLDRSVSSPPVEYPALGNRSPSRHVNMAQSHAREWTLFGQLMENEGQLRPRGSTARHRRRNTHSVTPSSPALSNAENRNPFLASSVSPDLESAHSAYQETLASEVCQDQEEYVSDDSDDSSTTPPSKQEPSTATRWFRVPSLSRLQKNVIKCALAYLLASLFTFVPYLSSLLTDVPSRGKWQGLPSPSGHMVATVSVYFNPAKTIGAMIEADIYVIFGLAFTTFFSLGSIGMFWFIEVEPGWEWFADALVLLWIAGAMIIMAWLKVWMARPSFNTACTMICIILFIVIVREGGIETLIQVSFIVIVGATISNVVCFTLWTESATGNLQDDMISALDSFATLLQTLTKTFLLDPDFHPKQSKLLRATEAHQKSFTSLKRNLTEAHSEWLSSCRTGSTEIAYNDAVDCLNRLAQHLGGLRSGTRLQADLIAALREGSLVPQPGLGHSKLFVWKSDKGSGVAGGTGKKKMSTEEDEDAVLSAAAVMFGDLIDDLGPPMSALSHACTTTLKRMQDAFQRHRKGDPMDAQEFFQLSEDIERALYAFDSTSNHAVMRLYRRSDMTDRLSMNSDDDIPPVLEHGDNETVFLVYFFIFTMQEFARELVLLVSAMGRIYALERRAAERKGLLRWIRRSFTCSRKRRDGQRSAKSKSRQSTLRRRLSTLVPIASAEQKLPKFPRVRPHAPNTVQTPARASLSFIGRLKQSFWALGARLQEPDLKYAFKTGVATAMLASPAFFPSTRPLFLEYRGEWALVSFFIVISPLIGQTNFLALHRVLATILGAGTAAGAFLIFHDRPEILAIFGFFYSMPCFYYILSLPKYAVSIRFVILTYNLTCLYCYNLRHKNPSVVTIGFWRAISVTIGVIWAFIVSQYWWPAEARRELGKALSEFCFNIGWLYSRMVVNYSTPPAVLLRVEPRQVSSETAPLLSQNGTGVSYTALTRGASEQLNSSIHDFLAMELHLQRKLITLQELLAQTQNEPRLKGPFPVKLYRSILTSLQTILDKLHSMRCVTTREEWYTSVRRDFIVPVSKERRELVGNVILYFSTLASAFRLKAPLPPYLPPAEKSRQELVNAMRRLDVVKTRNIKGSRQLLYFAYALMMKGVIQELDFLGSTLQEAFGILGGSKEDFENIFRIGDIEAEETETAG